MSMRSNYPSNNESGFVTVLMVLLVGMAIAASAVGTAYYVNSAQKGLASGHALTNAKSGAWTGVETFRQYLESLDEAEIQALNGQTGITLTAGSRTLNVRSLTVETIVTTNPTYRVTAEIQNTSTAAKSSATVQVVYDVTVATSPSGESGPTKVTVGGAMNFYGNLNAGGSIEFLNSPESGRGNGGGQANGGGRGNGGGQSDGGQSDGGQDDSGGQDDTDEYTVVVGVGGNFSSNTLQGINELRVGGIVDIGGQGVDGLEKIVVTEYKPEDFDLTGQAANFNRDNIVEDLSLLADQPIVNALDFEDYANYVFYVENNSIKVKVKHVAGLADGTYSLQGAGGGFSSVITYSNNNDKIQWTLSDGPIARGVLLFKGSVDISSKGDFVNTILATEDITYGNSNVTLTAPNRASAESVCNSIAFKMPTNLCTEDKKLRYNPEGEANENTIDILVGNIALLAGSCTDTTSVDSCSDTYTGGDITFRAQSNVVGSIVAGNRIDAAGGTTLRGPVLSAALHKQSNGDLSTTNLQGNFKLNFDGLTGSGLTITLPGSGDTGGSGTTTHTSQIKWARYI